MKKNLLDYIVVTVIVVFISGISYAQEIKSSGINLGVKVGTSKLLGEKPKGSAGFINEFDNQFGLAGGFEISKYISSRWEIAGDISYSVLKGNTNSPEFSAEGIHPLVPKDLTDPVEYQNKLMGYNFLFRYFFKPAGSESAFIPFISGGIGYLKYYSKFKYIDALDDDLIFGKGKDNGYATLSTPVFIAGSGFKSSFSSRFYFVTSIDFKIVSYDFLDVMHNYNNDGTKLKVTGLYTEIKIALFYNIGKSGSSKTNQSRRSDSSNITSYLPFSR